jgi:hypothetical protein
LIAGALPPNPWKQAVAAAKDNFIPGLALQAFALAVVLAYYYHPPTHAALSQLAGLKQRLGLFYSLVATSFFGGVIPFAYMRLNPRTRPFTRASHALFFAVFWAFKGVEVDLFYSAQAWLFGNDATVPVIVKKVLVDQLVYNPFYSAPIALLVFHWKESDFRSSSLRRLDWIGFQKRNLPKALIATWAVWFPAVAIIYSLPSALQIPLFNIVLCFYSLLYTSLTRKQEPVPARNITAAGV